MTNMFSRFVKEEDGATAIEYGLLAALISVVIIGAVTSLGTSIKSKFNDVATSINTSGATNPTL